MNISKACWQSFVDWLQGGTPGGLPTTLCLWLGPVWWFVPQARQVAEALGPWLVALLEARQRAGLARQAEWEVLQRDLEARPLTRREAEQGRAAWASWRLEAELLRLVRLVEAPTDLVLSVWVGAVGGALLGAGDCAGAVGPAVRSVRAPA